MGIFDGFYGDWQPEDPRPRGVAEPEPAPAQAQLSSAANALAAAIAGLSELEQLIVLRQVLVHAAAELQRLQGHVEASETLYRVGDHMAVACAAPDWREV